MNHLSRHVLPRRPTLCASANVHISTSIIQTPIGYHYANAPASSVDAVRKAVFTNFDISACIFIAHAKLGFQAHSSSLYTIAPAGIPGNDDQAAMATWLIWHLLGFYPGPLRSSIKAHDTDIFCTTSGIHCQNKKSLARASSS
jgi:hypothetical protein